MSRTVRRQADQSVQMPAMGCWRQGFVRWSGWFRRRSLMDSVLAKDDCGRRIPPGAYAQGTL